MIAPHRERYLRSARARMLEAHGLMLDAREFCSGSEYRKTTCNNVIRSLRKVIMQLEEDLIREGLMGPMDGMKRIS